MILILKSFRFLQHYVQKLNEVGLLNVSCYRCWEKLLLGSRAFLLQSFDYISNCFFWKYRKFQILVWSLDLKQSYIFRLLTLILYILCLVAIPWSFQKIFHRFLTSNEFSANLCEEWIVILCDDYFYTDCMCKKGRAALISPSDHVSLCCSSCKFCSSRCCNLHSNRAIRCWSPIGSEFSIRRCSVYTSSFGAIIQARINVYTIAITKLRLSLDGPKGGCKSKTQVWNNQSRLTFFFWCFQSVGG